MDADLDTTDLEILRILQIDATLTNKEIAFKLRKSIATIHDRIRKLKERGYIKKSRCYSGPAKNQ